MILSRTQSTAEFSSCPPPWMPHLVPRPRKRGARPCGRTLHPDLMRFRPPSSSTPLPSSLVSWLLSSLPRGRTLSCRCNGGPPMHSPSSKQVLAQTSAYEHSHSHSRTPCQGPAHSLP